MLRVAIIVGSTRPGRKGEAVARWVYEIAGSRGDAEFELVDIKDYDLPLLDEPKSAISGQYSNGHTKAWSAKIASFTIDYLFHEWKNKAAGFVGYGGAGGIRAVENLRLVMGELMVADVRAQVALSLYTDFENFEAFKPAPHQEKSVHDVLDQVIAWGGALRSLREQ